MPQIVAIMALGVLALAASLLLTPNIIRICQRHNVVDKPNERKVHTRDIPRLGGVAIFIAMTLGLAAAAIAVTYGKLDVPVEQAALIPVIYLGLCGFFMIGFLDDLKNLPVAPRLIAQLVVATLVVVFSDGAIRIGSVFGTFVFPDWLAVVCTVLWIVGVVNTFNWIDGLDGLSAGIGGISATAFLVLALLKPDQPNTVLTVILCILILGSVTGFLTYNFHPARIFIGDGGAFSLGYLLAIISVVGLFKQAAVITFFLPVLILALPITDTAFAIVRRMIRGRPITQADNRHIHHRFLSFMSRRYRSRLPEQSRSAIQDELEINPAHRNSVLALYAFAAVFAGIAVIVGVNA